MVHGIICHGIICQWGMTCCRIIYLGAMRLPLTLLHLLRKHAEWHAGRFSCSFLCTSEISVKLWNIRSRKKLRTHHLSRWLEHYWANPKGRTSASALLRSMYKETV